MVTTVDNVKDYWPSGMSNRHYYVINDDIRDWKLNHKSDLITSISVVEHIEQSDSAVR